MPKFIRKNLVDSFQKTLDCAWEFQQLENLDKYEMCEMVSLRNGLLDIQSKLNDLVSIVDEKPENVLPPPVGGPRFSWAEHDAKAIAARKKQKPKVSKEDRLKKKIARLEKRLKELGDEHSG